MDRWERWWELLDGRGKSTFGYIWFESFRLRYTCWKALGNLMVGVLQMAFL